MDDLTGLDFVDRGLQKAKTLFYALLQERKALEARVSELERRLRRSTVQTHLDAVDETIDRAADVAADCETGQQASDAIRKLKDGAAD